MNRKGYYGIHFVIILLLLLARADFAQRSVKNSPFPGDSKKSSSSVAGVEEKRIHGEKASYNYFRIDKSGRSLWNGKHWKPVDYPLKVYVKTTKSKYFKTKFRDYIDYALSLWEKADERILFEYVSNTRDADILIIFEENLIIKYDDNYLGITDYELTSEKRIEKSVIEIGLLKFNNEPVTEGEVKSTIIHEIGHALGLGHSNSESDIMFPFINPFSSSEMEFNELSDGDIEAIKSVVNLGFGISLN
jgi:hypothetical protein